MKRKESTIPYNLIMQHLLYMLYRARNSSLIPWSLFLDAWSCNGLLCLADEFCGHTYKMILWNPSIRKSVTIPLPHVTFCSPGPYRVVFGYGFDSRHNDYKIVGFTYVSHFPETEHYSLKEGSWRSISAAILSYRCDVSTCQAFVNGAVHWVGGGLVHLDGLPGLILAFDMGSEEFFAMNLPASPEHAGELDMSIAVLGESLFVFHRDGRATESVWVMIEYGVVGCWTKLFTFDFEDDNLGRMLGFRRNGVLLLTVHRRMVSFDVQAQQGKCRLV